MLLIDISCEQSVKILVKSLKNCKSYEHFIDGVSAFTEHVENHFSTVCGGVVECLYAIS